MKRLLFASFALAVASLASAATLKATDKGVAVDAGAAGKYTMEYPALIGSNQKVAHKLTQATPSENGASLTYDGGAKIELAIKDDTLAYTVADIPEDVKSLQTKMVITASAAKGKTFSFKEEAAKPFPAEKAERPHLYQGNAGTLTLSAGESKVTFTNPFPFTYNQLSDNRHWNWAVFMWQANTPINKDVKTYTLKVSSK